MIKYQVSTYLRASLPRSQRLRAISYNPGSTNSSSAETHRHDNKAVLDALTEVDGDGYLHIKFIKEGSSVTEKVKAGYADKWGGWEFGDFFERVNVGSDECPIYALRVKMGLFSDSFVSSKGISKDIGDSAIGINLSSVWESLTSNVDTFKNSKIHIDHLPILTADDISNLSTFVDDAIKATTISQFYNDAGYITRSAIPTNISALTNDAGFITASSIINKADKATTLAGYGITDAIPYKELQVVPYASSVGYGYPAAGFKTAGGFVAAVHHGGQYGFALQGENGNSGLYYRGMVAGVWNETWRTIAFTDTKVDNAKNADSLGTYSSDKYMRGFVDGTIDVNSNVFDWNRPYIWRTTSNPNTPINHAHILHVTASGSDGAFELCGAMNEDKLLFRRGSMSTDSTQATLYKNAWKEIAFAATTLAGYGITDAMPYIGTVDANSVKSSGYAYVTSNGAGGNGGLISFGGTSYQTQLYADYLGKDLYWRANSNGTYTTWQKIATKGSTLSHYGITDAVTIATGQTITGEKIFQTGGGSNVPLRIRNNAERAFIQAGDTKESYVHKMCISALNVFALAELEVLAQDIKLRGNVNANSLTIGGATISWDSTNQMLKIDKGIYSLGAISAKGVSNSTGETGGGVDLTTMWDSLRENNALNVIHISHIPSIPTTKIENFASSVENLIPTNVSQFTNDAGFITASAIANKADKATTLAGYGITDGVKAVAYGGDAITYNAVGYASSTNGTAFNGLFVCGMFSNGNYGGQLIGSYKGDRLSYRGRNNGEWTEWVDIATKGTTLEHYGITDGVKNVSQGGDDTNFSAIGYGYSANGAYNYGLFVSGINGRYGGQLSGSFTGNELAFRGLNDGAWTDWKRIILQGDTWANVNYYTLDINSTSANSDGCRIMLNINGTASATIGIEGNKSFFWNRVAGKSLEMDSTIRYGGSTLYSAVYAYDGSNYKADSITLPLALMPNVTGESGDNWKFYDTKFYGSASATSRRTQVAYGYDKDTIHFRRYNNGWADWRKVAWEDEVVKIGADITAPNIHASTLLTANSATFANGDISINSDGLIMSPAFGINIGDYLTVNGGTTEIWGDYFRVGANSTIFYNSVNINGNVDISSMIRTNSDTGILSLDGNYIDVYAPINIKSTMKIGEATLYWDSTNKMLKVDTGAYFIGPVSSKGVSNGEDGSFAIAQFGLYWEDLWAVDKSAYFESFGNLTNLNTISTGISNGSNIEIICDALIGKSSSDIEIHTVGLKGEAPPDVKLIPYKINGNTLTCKLFLTGSLSLVGFKIKIY